MTAVLVVFVGCLGLAVGSFLNVVIHRVPLGMSVVSPPSRCPGCAAPIRAWQNVPVLSWLVLRGRCAGCRTGISVRYPLVELGTGVVFALLAGHFGPSAVLPAYLFLAAVGIALLAIDLDVRRLPDVLVLPSYGVGLVALGAAAWADGTVWPLVRGIVAMAAVWTLFLALALAHPGGMGFGDVKLSGVLGLFLGYIGWGPVVVGVFGAFVAGALVGGVLALVRHRGRRAGIPFGPFLVGAALVAVFAAGPVVHWYGSLVGFA